MGQSRATAMSSKTRDKPKKEKSSSKKKSDPPTDEMSKLKVGSKSKSTKDESGKASSSSSKDAAKGSAGVDKDTIIQANGVSYRPVRVVGTGSFGVVIQAQMVDAGELVAIKKVLQDKRFKNR